MGGSAIYITIIRVIIMICSVGDHLLPNGSNQYLHCFVIMMFMLIVYIIIHILIRITT